MKKLAILAALWISGSLALGNPPVESGKAVSPQPEQKKEPSAKDAPSQLVLAGITFTVPAGWKSLEIPPGPMAPKAVYSIPARKAGEDEGAIRITHYPEMKGKDDMNIDRWVGQVTKADGKAASRADAKIEKVETGNIRLTTIDLSGSVKMTMRESSKANHRMIATIVDHPKGPHFVVASGPVESMNTWATDIMNFIKSAKVTE